MASQISNMEYQEWNRNDSLHPNLTTIQKFYSQKNVFITGSTGFLGKLLVEKLLWSCPDIGDIYLMVRDKKGKSLNTRVDDLFDSPAFVRVKRTVLNYKDKIKIIAGDCAFPGLGICDADRAVLIREVNIVFHVAATVRFQEPLKNALSLNVRATKDMIDLAKEMVNLKSYIHVSTAFANSYMTDLKECFYETPIDPIHLLNFVDTSDQTIIDEITPKLLGKWPNTYTFTKSLAEDFIRQNAVGMPVGIMRPSIVVSSVKEPVPHWVDNWYGVSGFITACGAGLLRAIRTKKDGEANIVPADMCVNAMIASAWDVADRFHNVNSSPTSGDIRIFNFVLKDNPLKWAELYNQTSFYGTKVPPIQAVWYCCLVINSGEKTHATVRYFLHFIPAVLADGMLMCIGRKPRFLDLCRRIDTMADVTAFFTIQDWNFSNDNMLKLIEKMSDADKIMYHCDVRSINWMDFLKGYFLGIRRYLLKDDDSTLPAARKKYAKLYILHRTLQAVCIFALMKASHVAITAILTIIQ